MTIQSPIVYDTKTVTKVLPISRVFTAAELGTISAGTSRKFEMVVERGAVLNVEAFIKSYVHATGGTGYGLSLYAITTGPSGEIVQGLTREILSTTSAIATTLQLFPSTQDHMGVSNSTGGRVAGINLNPVEINGTGALTALNTDTLQIPNTILPLTHGFGQTKIGFEITGGPTTGNLTVDMDLVYRILILSNGSQSPQGKQDDWKFGAGVNTDSSGNLQVTTTIPSTGATSTVARFTQ